MPFSGVGRFGTWLASGALALGMAGGAGAEVYRWVDSDGVTHYSDEPRQGAEAIDPGEPSVIRMAPELRTAPQTGSEAREPSPRDVYRDFAISEPADEATLRGNPGDVPVVLALQPPQLRPGHELVLLLDGQPAPAQPGSSLRVVLQEVPRGTHTLQAEIRDADGDVVTSTGRVTFYMHRPSVNLPARQGTAN